MNLIIQELTALAERIRQYQSSGYRYDEWEDTDSCSILTSVESPTFEPLFERYTLILDTLSTHEPLTTIEENPPVLLAPLREITTDNYGQTIVCYYFSGANHLEVLAKAVQHTLDRLGH